MILLLVALAGTNLLLGFFTWINGRKKVVNNIFFWLTIFVVAWATSNYLADYYADITKNQELSYLFTRLTFASSSLIGGSFLYFSLLFVDSKIRISTAVTAFIVSSTLIISAITLGTNQIISGVEINQNTVLIFNGQLYYLYLAHFLIAFSFAFYKLLARYRSSRANKRDRIQYLFLGTFLSVIAAVFANLIIPTLNESIRSSRYGPYFTVFFVGFTAYAIVAHRLFDIRVIIKRTVVYSVLLGFVLITYALVVLVFSQVFGGETTLSVKSFVPNVVAAILIAFGFDPLRRWLQTTTDKYLFKGEYDPQDLANELARMLSNVVNLDEALESMMSVLTQSMRIGRVATLVIRKIDKDMVVKRVKATGFSNVIKLENLPTGQLIEYFGKHSQIIVMDELQDLLEDEEKHNATLHAVFTQLEQFHAAVALPLSVKDTIIGILMVGEKLSGDSFSRQDLDSLELIGSQTALSIEKAQFYEEDKLKSEFISIASHELLTPTAAIEGYLSMALDEKMPQTKEQHHQYMQRAYDSSRRLADLVKDLLSISRIESGRMKIAPTTLDITTIVDQAVSELQVAAKDKGLTLEFAKPSPAVPKVVADPDRIMQVCINLINNAIKYTPKGGIKVLVEPAGRMVSISVVDTGMGIAPEDQKHLFEKFHRIDTPATAGIMGTGLGLYIVKNIITLLGGTVEVKSAAGKGSTFTFTLPVAK